METSACFSCSTQVLKNAVFCHHCGQKIKCSNCNSDLLKGANFCINCGDSVLVRPGGRPAMNTFKVHKTANELLCEASLNDGVAKEGIMGVLEKLSGPQVEYKALSNGGSLAPGQESNGHVIADTKHQEISSTISTAQQVMHSNTGNEIDELPHIKDIEMTLDCSESEWMLVYAFYESEYGTKNFTKAAVYDRYMAKRKTSERVKNFSQYWKRLFKKYISTVNETELKLKKDCLADIRDLILGNSKSSERTTVKRKTSTDSKTGTNNTVSPDAGKEKLKTKSKSIQLEKFDLHRDATTVSLEDFLKEKSPGKATAKIVAVIAYYITNLKGQPSFSEGNIDYAYRTLSIPGRPIHLHQILINAKGKDLFEMTGENGVWKLTRTGEIFVEEKLPPKSK